MEFWELENDTHQNFAFNFLLNLFFQLTLKKIQKIKIKIKRKNKEIKTTGQVYIKELALL